MSRLWGSKNKKLRVDLTGKVFGHLLVKEFVGRAKDGQSIWKCDCVCGRDDCKKEHNVRYGHLKDGTSVNCGRLLVVACKHGHAFTPENTRIDSRGVRLCRTCRKAYTKNDLRKAMNLRDWKRKKRKREPKWVTNNHLMRKYGITLEMRDEMYKQQAGCCAICEKSMGEKPCTDHNHKTRIVRQLLCDMCNKGLGQFKEDVLILEKAIEYIRRHNAASITNVEKNTPRRVRTGGEVSIASSSCIAAQQ